MNGYLYCGNQMQSYLCFRNDPALAYRSCKVSHKGITRPAKYLHDALGSILKRFDEFLLPVDKDL